MDRDRIIRQIAKSNIKAEGKRTVLTVGEMLGQGGNGVAFVVKSAAKEFVAKFYVPPDKRDLDNAAYKRFQREIELASRISHPFVVPSKGVGVVSIGAYRFPFYLMPRAEGTFRQLIPSSFDFRDLGMRLRVFTRALAGVCYLHHLGIVHRDLKPENILLFAHNTPKVADLGIAHVAPGFVDWSRLTVPKDRLMNWDYYAPEQRYGDATKVDQRADIYALGCILYELLAGISPTRPNLPTLSSLHPKLTHLDSMFRKMTAHSPSKRYHHLDEVADELTWILIHIGIPTEAPSSDEEEKKKLVKYLRSTNAATQERALDVAHRLGQKALPELHEQAGDRRLSVALAAYRIIGELCNKDSLTYLLAGLYPQRTSQKPKFPTGEAAAHAIRNYPEEDRLNLLNNAKDMVLASHVEIVVAGIAPEKSYPCVQRLYQEKLLHEDWGSEAGLGLLLRIDSDRAWSLVQEKLSETEALYSFTVFRHIFPFVSKARQMHLVDYLISRPGELSSWELPKVLAAVATGGFPPKAALKRIGQLKDLAQSVIRKYDERQRFLTSASLAEKKIAVHHGLEGDESAEQPDAPDK